MQLCTRWYMIKNKRQGIVMSETYVECLVKAKSRKLFSILFYVLIVFGVLAFFSMLILGVISVILTVASALGAYFIKLNSEIEYEYLYLDKELSVDKIMAQTKRKRVATYSLSRMEIMAPVKSYHLDDYKNRQVKIRDYSMGAGHQPDTRYVFYYEGKEKIVFNPSEEMIKAIRNAAPRKVFTD